MVNDEIIIYYSKWDGKNGSHDLLKQAAVKWRKRHQGTETDLTGDWQWGPEAKSAPDASCFVIRQEDAFKKPYFEYPKGVEFSISHTGNMWMCAMSDIPVGLDVQEANRCKRDKLSGRFFHPDEDAWLSSHQYGGFYHVWAAKESYLKYTGDGLSYGMDRFCVVSGDGFCKEVNGIRQRHFVCSPRDGESASDPAADAPKDGESVCLEAGFSDDGNRWRFEEYLPGKEMDILPEEERLALCVSFKGERKIRFWQL